MKTDRVVCVKQFMNSLDVNGLPANGPRPIKGEIYTVVMVFGVGDSDGLVCYVLKELHPKDSWNIKYFRPVDDSFGEWVQETIMEDIEELVTQELQ